MEQRASTAVARDADERCTGRRSQQAVDDVGKLRNKSELHKVVIDTSIYGRPEPGGRGHAVDLERSTIGGEEPDRELDHRRRRCRIG